MKILNKILECAPMAFISGILILFGTGSALYLINNWDDIDPMHKVYQLYLIQGISNIMIRGIFSNKLRKVSMKNIWVILASILFLPVTLYQIIFYKAPK